MRSSLGNVVNKEDLGNRYYEVKSIQLLTYLLKRDKDALFRVMNAIKMAIYEEESKKLAERTIEKAKK